MKGHIRRRGQDSWALVFDLPRDKRTRKRRQKWISFRGTKREGHRELRRLLHEQETGSLLERPKMALAQYLNSWLEIIKSQAKPTTYRGYENIVVNHLIPQIGATELCELSSEDIEQYLQYGLARGRADGKGGLHPRTVHHHYAVLHRALQYAVSTRRIAWNPAAAVQPPRAEDPIRHVYSREQVKELLEAARETPLHIVVLLLATTGMRRGELLALRWSDVDLKADRLFVRRNVARIRTELVFSSPKSKASRRQIQLPPAVTAELRQHRHRQEGRFQMLGILPTPDDLVCCRVDGRPLEPDQVSREFRQLVGKAGLPEIGLHALRHTHATALLEAGVNVKAVAERLGHASVRVTLEVYAHVLPSMQEKAVSAISDMYEL